MTTLAVLGGAPAFSEPLHVGRPSVLRPHRVLELIGGALDRRVLTHGGPLLREFERAVAAVAGVAHCVATCNATIAMQLLVRAMGLRGEVVLPSWTFIATAHALLWEGVTPVFCDVDERTGNLDPRSVAELITPRTSAIAAVHMWGVPAPAQQLTSLAREHGLRLYFDSAHAVAGRCDGRPVGGHGAAEVFSFHATKLVNAFEGGAVVTDDGELAERVRAMRDYGRNGDGTVGMLGLNAKMTEPSAAMGLVSLEDLDRLLAVHRERHERYAAGLAGVPGVRLRDPASRESNRSYAVVEVDQEYAGLTRDELCAVLHAENVLARNHFHPGCHRSEPYRRAPRRHTPRPLTATEALSGRVLVLPTGTSLENQDVDRVCEVIGEAVRRAPAVRAWASSRTPAAPRR